MSEEWMQPENERELKLATFWNDYGFKHSEPSPKTIEVMKKQEKMLENQKATLGVVVERLENLIRITQEHHLENTAYHKTSNGRIGKLEGWRTFLFGAWTVIAFTSTVLLPFLGYYFMRTTRFEIINEIENRIQISVDKKMKEGYVDGSKYVK